MRVVRFLAALAIVLLGAWATAHGQLALAAAARGGADRGEQRVDRVRRHPALGRDGLRTPGQAGHRRAEPAGHRHAVELRPAAGAHRPGLQLPAPAPRLPPHRLLGAHRRRGAPPVPPRRGRMDHRGAGRSRGGRRSSASRARSTTRSTWRSTRAWTTRCSDAGNGSAWRGTWPTSTPGRWTSRATFAPATASRWCWSGWSPRRARSGSGGSSPPT